MLLLLAASPRCAVADLDSGWRLGLGVGGGALLLDQDLANFRWDTGPIGVWGISGRALTGRWSLGLGLQASSTVQASGIPGETVAPEVELLSARLTAAYRVAEAAGFELWANAHGGRLHMSWSPDHLFFDPLGSGELVEVRYAPIDEWVGGLGMAFRREFASRVALALQIERTSFSLDTAHRRGSEIIEERQAFHSWGLGLQVSWLLGL